MPKPRISGSVAVATCLGNDNSGADDLLVVALLKNYCSSSSCIAVAFLEPLRHWSCLALDEMTTAPTAGPSSLKARSSRACQASLQQARASHVPGGHRPKELRCIPSEFGTGRRWQML